MPASEFSGNLIDSPFFGDFNGDGKLDLGYRSRTFPRSNTPFLEFRLGKGDGTFSLPIFSVGGSAKEDLAQDLSANKLTDLITVGTANDVDVLLNTSPASGADLGAFSLGSSPQPVALGANLTFGGDVLNLGPRDATGVTLTDTLPNSVSFVSATATQGSCVQSHGIVSCSIGSLASGSDSKVSIVVTPALVGAISNSMSVTANEPDLVPGNNNATQTAVVVAPDFSLTPASVSLTVQPGGQGTDTITIAPQNGFFGSAIELSCSVSGPSPMPICGLSPTTVMLGTNSAASRLTIRVPASRAMLVPPIDRSLNKSAFAVLLPLPGIVFVGLALVSSESRKRRHGLWLLCGLVFAATFVQAGCGGGGSSTTTPPPTPASYTITVTGTASSTNQHTTQIIVSVP